MRPQSAKPRHQTPIKYPVITEQTNRSRFEKSNLKRKGGISPQSNSSNKKSKVKLI